MFIAQGNGKVQGKVVSTGHLHPGLSADICLLGGIQGGNSMTLHSSFTISIFDQGLILV